VLIFQALIFRLTNIVTVILGKHNRNGRACTTLRARYVIVHSGNLPTLRVLKRNAVPHIFAWSDGHKQSVAETEFTDHRNAGKDNSCSGSQLTKLAWTLLVKKLSLLCMCPVVSVHSVLCAHIEANSASYPQRDRK